MKANSRIKDGVDIAKEKRKVYPSIKIINENISRFSFYGTHALDTQKQVSNLNSKKQGLWNRY